MRQCNQSAHLHTTTTTSTTTTTTSTNTTSHTQTQKTPCAVLFINIDQIIFLNEIKQDLSSCRVATPPTSQLTRHPGGVGGGGEEEKKSWKTPIRCLYLVAFNCVIIDLTIIRF